MNAPYRPCAAPAESSAPAFLLRTGERPGRFLTPPVLSGAGAGDPAWRVMDTPHHLCTASSESSSPAFLLRTGERPGHFLTPSVLSGAGAGGPAWRAMDTPYYPCTASSESITSVFFFGREESGRLLWGTALSQGVLRDVPQYVIYSPARQRAKNRQPLTHSGKQGLPVFVLGFLPHRGRGIGGLSPGWPGASCSGTERCSGRYSSLSRRIQPRGSCAPADRCPASGGFPPG